MDRAHAISMPEEIPEGSWKAKKINKPEKIGQNVETEEANELYLAVDCSNLTKVNRLCRIIDEKSLDKTISLRQSELLKFVDDLKRTPLNLAVHMDSVDLVGVISRCANLLIKNKYLDSKSFLCAQDSSGKTVLHTALENHNKEVVSCLLDIEVGNKKFLEAKDTQSGLTALHIAVKESLFDVLKVLCDHYGNLKALDDKGRSALNLATENYSDALAGLQDCNESTIGVLSWSSVSSLESALKRKYYQTVEHLSTLRQTENTDVRCAFTIIYGMFAEVTSNLNLGKIHRILRTLPDSSDFKEIVGIFFTEDPEIIKTLTTHRDDVSVHTEEKTLITIIINFLLVGVEKFFDDPKFRIIFFKGNSFTSIIQLLIDNDRTEDNNINSIRHVFAVTFYKCIQSKASCKETESTFLKFILDGKTWTDFSSLVDQIDKSNCSTVWLNISKTYFPVKKVSWYTSLVQTLEKGEDSLPRVTHSCKLQGYLATFTCSSAIFIYISDLLSDANVGYEDYRNFSKRLGIFEIFLVSFSFIHENVYSNISLRDTEEELLKIHLGKPELAFADWQSKHAVLNKSEHWKQELFYRLFWPFRVTGDRLKRIKAIIFNIMSAIMLRPVVDRLRVLTHSPTTHRVFYRHKANQAHLQQFYMIMEQIPELLVQFYTLQIVINNISPDQRPECYSVDSHAFQYYQFYNSSTTSCTSTFSIITSLGMCSAYIQIYTAMLPLIRVYSIAIPFCKVPTSVVSLEKIMRKLDPTSPKISITNTILLNIAYMMMIPSRIFLFSGLMHSFTNHIYVIGYLILSSFLWLLVNLTIFKGFKLLKIQNTGQGTVKKIMMTCKNLWLLYVFSFRDIFIISLRNPESYIKEPSDASNESLRGTYTLLKLSVPFVVEGVIGASLLDQLYPCGMQSNLV